LLAAAVMLLVSACGPSKPSRPPCPQGKVCLEYGNGSEPLTLDPALSAGTWENRIIGDLMEGLASEDAAGRPIPGVATSWETSADGLVWTFHLRRSRWSDGAPLTAEDFVFGLRRTLDPKTASEYAALLYAIKNAEAVNTGRAPPEQLGVSAPDPYTVRIELAHPAPYLLQLAAHTTTMPAPRHVLAKDPKAWAQPGKYVSNGAYTLAAWRLGDRVTVVRNPRYYGAEDVCIDQINYYPTTDTSSAERRVRRGELDINSDIQSNRIAFLRQPDQMPAYVRVHTYFGTAYMPFNTAGAPALRDRRVRQALAMAIDRDFITKKLLRGGQVSAYALVPPGTANYQAGPRFYWADWTFERRQSEARRLLAEAGYGPGRPLKIEIKHRNSADPSLFMPAVQADWKAIGVDATIVATEVQIAYASFRAKDFQVGDVGWIGDYNDPMAFLYLQQSQTGGQNYGGYNNPRYDALLAQADNEADIARRAALLAEAEQLLLDDAPIAPLYNYVNKNLVSPRVTGWVDNLVDHHRAKYLCLKDPPSAP